MSSGKSGQKHSRSKPSTSKGKSRKTDDESSCRICQDDINEATITPCKCKGSMGCVHATCLERWLAESGRDSCEICGQKYNIHGNERCSFIKRACASVLKFCRASSTRTPRTSERTRREHAIRNIPLSYWECLNASRPMNSRRPNHRGLYAGDRYMTARPLQELNCIVEMPTSSQVNVNVVAPTPRRRPLPNVMGDRFVQQEWMRRREEDTRCIRSSSTDTIYPDFDINTT